MSAEEWRVITDWPRYEVSSHGRVRFAESGRIVPQSRHPDGYHQVSLVRLTRESDNALPKSKKFRAHRLVASVFIKNPNGKPQVNHIDGNKRNNHAGNLEWVTGRENMAHAHSTGLMPSQKGEKNPRAKLSGHQVRQAIQMHHEGMNQCAIGRALGVTNSMIHLIVKGKAWQSVNVRNTQPIL